MSTVILVRHAHVVARSDVPSKDWILSPGGHEAAAVLAQHPEVRAAVAVYASPERKARETALILAGDRGVETIEDLRELDREPLGWVGSSDRYAAVVEDILASPAASVLGCERAVDAARRFEDAILSFALAHPGRSVVAVSHGIVLTLYMSRLLGIAPPSVSIWRSLRFSDRAVVQPESRRVIECFGGVRQWPRLD